VYFLQNYLDDTLMSDYCVSYDCIHKYPKVSQTQSSNYSVRTDQTIHKLSALCIFLRFIASHAQYVQSKKVDSVVDL
jgi:hypothetical protein